MTGTDPQGSVEFDAHAFRTAMGQFATGVAVITTRTADGAPVGFACQSFAALSLDPPLVLFCPMKTSRTWRQIEASGGFCVNVLSARQQGVSAIFGSSGDDKFRDIAWDAAPSGHPVLRESLAWADCDVERVVAGGDHHIVIGRVRVLGTERADLAADRPLLFYRGGYLSTEHPRVEAPHTDLANLLTWTGDDTWL